MVFTLNIMVFTLPFLHSTSVFMLRHVAAGLRYFHTNTTFHVSPAFLTERSVTSFLLYLHCRPLADSLISRDDHGSSKVNLNTINQQNYKQLQCKAQGQSEDCVRL